MTIDVDAPAEGRRTPGAGPGHAGRTIRSVVATAPEQLLLAFLAFCYVSAAAYVTGVFRPIVVLPGTAVVVALIWRFRPAAGPRDTASAWGSVGSLGVAGAWFLLNLPYLAERVHVGRDPDVYTLTALWLLDHSNLSIPVPDSSTESPGFYLVDGHLEPQGNHLVAAVSASVGWLLGEEAIFWGNLACGAAALVALYGLGRLLLGPVWAFVPVLALAVSMPMLEFSRAMYSEPLAMTFTFLGASLLWGAWTSDRLGGYLLAGAAFGGVALARIDGTLPLIGVVAGLAIATVLSPREGDGARRWAGLAVLAGSLPGVLLGFADLYFHSGRYIADLRSQFAMLGVGLLVAAVLAVAAAAVPDRRRAVVTRFVSVATLAGAAVVAVAFAVLFTRPWWYVAHGDDIPLVAGLQAQEGDPVDGTRTYAEASFQWLSWYYGWPTLLVGLGGLLAWLVLGARSKSTRLLWLAALFLPSAAVYLTQPSIVPDQIWAMRRFLPVVVPGLLLGSVWVARQISGRRRPVGAIAATVLVVSIAVWPVKTANDLWSVKDNAGGLFGMRQVCDQIDGRPAVVTQQDTYLPTILALCDVPTFSVAATTTEALDMAREEMGGSPAVLVTRTPEAVPWTDSQPEPSVVYAQSIWERTLTGPPHRAVATPVSVTLGVVEADGSVTPLSSGN